MNKANRDKLKALEMEQLKIKYPSMREEHIPLTEWKDNSANNLTKCIIFWIKAMGGKLRESAIKDSTELARALRLHQE
jgi:hypothetical protein